MVAPHRTGDTDMAFRTLAILTVAAGLASAPAFASQPESNLIAVHSADLDLSTPAGVKTLHRRIARAMEAVCGSYEGNQTVGAETEAESITKCRAANRAVVDQRVAELVATSAWVASTR
jgi:UrcA family protein